MKRPAAAAPHCRPTKPAVSNAAAGPSKLAERPKASEKGKGPIIGVNQQMSNAESDIEIVSGPPKNSKASTKEQVVMKKQVAGESSKAVQKRKRNKSSDNDNDNIAPKDEGGKSHRIVLNGTLLERVEQLIALGRPETCEQCRIDGVKCVPKNYKKASYKIGTDGLVGVACEGCTTNTAKCHCMWYGLPSFIK